MHLCIHIIYIHINCVLYKFSTNFSTSFIKSKVKKLSQRNRNEVASCNFKYDSGTWNEKINAKYYLYISIKISRVQYILTYTFHLKIRGV